MIFVTLQTQYRLNISKICNIRNGRFSGKVLIEINSNTILNWLWKLRSQGNDEKAKIKSPVYLK
jgi:hypothetical protein